MIILLGKTASGKDTIVNYLVNNLGYKKLITYTTRPMRPGEVQNLQYHFISEEDFKKKISHGFFLEYKTYHTEFGDWYYGSAMDDYKKADDKTVVILTPEGYLDLLWKVKNIKHDAIYIKVDLLELQQRLIKRGDDKREAERRLIHDNKDFEYVENIVDRIVINQSKTIDEVINEIIKR